MTDETDAQLTPAGRQGVAVAGPRISDDMAEALFYARGVVQKAREDLDIAKEVAKNRKAQYAKAVQKVLRLVREAEEGPGPLFDGQDAKLTPDGNPRSADWIATLLTELDLPAYITASLELYPVGGGGVTTLGRLMDLQKDLGETWSQAVTGIGDVARQKIDDAVEKYFMDHPRPAADEAEVDGEQHTEETP